MFYIDIFFYSGSIRKHMAISQQQSHDFVEEGPKRDSWCRPVPSEHPETQRVNLLRERFRSDLSHEY